MVEPNWDSPWLELVSHQKSYAFLFAAAAISTFLGTPLFIRLALRRDWIDRPGGRKGHALATPTMGGLVIFAAVFAGAAITLAWPNRVGEQLRDHARYVVAALACTAVAIALGIIDDRRGVRVK